MVKFDGSNKLNFKRSKDMLFAIWMLKDCFQDAYLQDLPFIDTLVSPNVPDTISIHKQELAWGYLVLSLKKAPSIMISHIAIQDTFIAWTTLTN